MAKQNNTPNDSQNDSSNNNARAFWTGLEMRAADEAAPTAAELLAHVRFDEAGLIPVVTQCAQTQAVLMLAWMNEAAISETLARGEMFYYSRSRKCLWHKGETSGHYQKLCSLALDCDGDALLAQVQQTGAACHTGKPSCFYNTLK